MKSFPGGIVKISKLMVAFALFVSSVTFERQLTATQNGLASNWEVSISVTNEAVAVAIEDTVTNLF